MSRFGFQPSQWPRLSALLDQAMDMDATARVNWLAQLGPEHQDLRADLESLLREATPQSLHLPSLDADQDDSEAHAERRHRGDVIGPYRLVHLLGRGGMGSVWLALRVDGQLQRPVALKLPRVTVDAPGLAERMARERDMLSVLSHPHIAQLYDAGLTEDGQPYLALEVVDGEPIDTYCSTHGLTIAARLALFLQVADAVAHAHARLVVHRDLKPGNLLVDRQGNVKLLDFGIAKVLDTGPLPRADLTQAGARLMTPEYASPEQIARAPVGTASDIYSLGVLLHVLLTGKRPYRLARDSRAALEEAILLQPPTRPSEVAQDQSQRRALRGDLDTVVGKALKKRPDERYATVQAFADDIQRHLDRRPVLAQPDRFGYVFGRFVARHRLGVGAAVLAGLAVLTGAGAAVWQGQKAQAERQRASDVKDFVTALMRDASPYYGGDVSKVTAADLMRQARLRLSAAPPADAAVRVELTTVVAEALLTFGDLAAAETMLADAVRLSRSELGDDHLETLRARLVQLQVHRQRGRQAEGRAELNDLMPALRRRAADDPEPLVLGLENEAMLAIDRGAPADAAKAAAEAATLADRHLPEGHRERLSSHALLAMAQFFGGQYPAARLAAEHALAELRRSHGESPHPRRMEIMVIHARALGELGELAPCVAELESAIALASQTLGKDNPSVGIYRQNVVTYLVELGRLDDAETQSAEALRVLAQHMQPASYSYAGTLSTRGAVLLARGQTLGALALLTEAAQTLNEVLGPAHAIALTAQTNRVLALQRLGRWDEAGSLASTLTPFAQAPTTPPHLQLRIARVLLGLERPPLPGSKQLELVKSLIAAEPSTARARRERARARVDLGLSHQAAGELTAAAASWQAALTELRALEDQPSIEQTAARQGLVALQTR